MGGNVRLSSTIYQARILLDEGNTSRLDISQQWRLTKASEMKNSRNELMKTLKIAIHV